jgi:hypothetical protein
MSGTGSDPSIDHEALRARYRAERDKRLRPDGNDQYLQPTGRYAHFLDDPYVQRVERAAEQCDVEVVCIGAGFAGVVTAARLSTTSVWWTARATWAVRGTGTATRVPCAIPPP